MKAISLALLVIFTASVYAFGQLPRLDDGDPGASCVDSSGVETKLRTTGRYLPGATIGIRAEEPLRMWAKTPLKTNPKFCKSTAGLVPHGNWTWELLDRPALSGSKLIGTNETSVTLLLDKPGVYRIRFTPCSKGCALKVSGFGTVQIEAESSEIVVRVLAILPPATLPTLPPLPSSTPSSFSSHCPWDAEYLSAAWRTVNPWSGAKDYKLLEGKVTDSAVSTDDNDLNHDSMDWHFTVTPHPWSRVLLRRGESDMDVEWERNFLPEKYRPTKGDFVAAIGYWIYDCAHGRKTEIHPPVLLATQRPRPIELPANAGAGSNAFVPGIVTDIWVNREAGDITNGCPDRGLDQQRDPSKPPLFDSQGFPKARCLPDSEGFSSNPINKIFEFNIYLPRSPHSIMAAVGKVVPPVPLFTRGCVPPGSLGLEPVCEVATAGGVTFLKVRIDLRTYDQQTYSRRIVAGWAHAAPDNWGARRWNVRVTSLDISDDGDTGTDGDWRFWVNTNNGASEWAKLFDCANCAHGNETFGGRAWETNSASNDRSLGSSIVLFPNQLIWLATSGFESEWYEDTIARLSLNLVQQRVSNGRAVADDGVGKYTMHYQVLPGEEIGAAQLSTAARARYDAYLLTNTESLGAIHGPLLDGVFSAAFVRSGQPPSEMAVTEREGSISEMRKSATQMSEMTQRALRENPVKLDAYFKDLKRVLQSAKTLEDKEEAHQFLKKLKSIISPALWQKHGFEAVLLMLGKAT